MKLTVIQVQRAKATACEYNLPDGKGLYLAVTPAGGKYWRYNFRRADGKATRMTIGDYPKLSLADARITHTALHTQRRADLLAGTDPATKRRRAREQSAVESATTFELIARDWHANKAKKWSEEGAKRILRRLEQHAFPKIGAIPVTALLAADVRDLVKAIDATGKHETAGRVLQYIGSALNKAKVDGLVTEVVTSFLDTSDTLSAHTVEHHPRVPESEMGQLFRDIAGANIHPVTRLALMLLFLTAGAMRPANLNRARWSEFDIDAARWTIPPAKMKGTKKQKQGGGAFIVPLSTQALAVIAELRTLTGHRPHLFPNHHDPLGHMSANAMGYALNRMGYQRRQVPHGARGLFSTTANESGKWDGDLVELCIAHQVGSAVRKAYNSAQRLADRARLMQWWGDKIQAARDGASIIEFRRAV